MLSINLFGRTVCAVAVCGCLVTIASAGIIVNGDVDPADPATWTSGTDAYIGKTAAGSVSIDDGTDLSSRTGYIGDTFIGNGGEVTVDGGGTTWTVTIQTRVGNTGEGTLNITNGGTVSDSSGYIGYSMGTFSSDGEVNVDGTDSTWEHSSGMDVGYYGLGTLNVTNGGTVTGGFANDIGHYAPSAGEVTVDGMGSTLTCSGSLTVGRNGKGTMSITNGGVVTNTWAIIGAYVGYDSAVTVDGAGSQWICSGTYGSLRVSSQGNAELNITNRGQVRVEDTLTIDESGGGGEGFVNMSTGGMLALKGDADDSLADFLAMIDGNGVIRYWDDSISDWADIAGATYGEDYTLASMTTGDLAGFTVLTVGIPEPATMSLLAMGGLAMLKRRKR